MGRGDYFQMKERLFTNVHIALMYTIAVVAVSTMCVTRSLAAAIPVLTYHYNNARTGANGSETILTPANVNMSQFGKVFSLPVNGGIYAQPLYVPTVTIPNQGTHNVVYIATQHNSLYAVDADNGTRLWSVNLGPYQRNPQN